MTKEITLPSPPITLIDGMEGKTIKRVAHSCDNLSILYTDGSVTILESRVGDDYNYLCDSFEIHEYILLDLGLIAEEELNAWVEQKIARQQQQVKDERYAHFLKLKKEFENDK